MADYNAKSLVDRAREARKFSQAKYSQFKVGAALLGADGKLYSGCNVESSSYGLTICAERVALTKALSEGTTQFTAIAIAAKDDDYCPPCGACRQLLHDYAPDIDVIMDNGRNLQIMKLRDLLPFAFEESRLGKS